MRSLRARLLLAMLIVSSATLALAGWVSRRYVEFALDEHLARDSTVDVARFAAPLDAWFAKNGRQNGVEPVLQQVSKASGRRALLTAENGTAIALAPETLADAKVSWGAGDSLTIEWNGQDTSEMRLINPPHAPVHGADGSTLTLYLLPLARPSPDGSPAIAPSGRRLVISLAGVVFLALTATLLVSRHILRPLGSLKSAVQKMEAGDPAPRVTVTTRDELGELGSAFNHMAERRESAERARREMVSDAAHELRTPVTNIRCQIEALQDGLAPVSPEAMASLHEETLNLARLLDDLQDLAMADAGQLKVTLGVSSPLALVESAAGAIAPRLVAAHISLAVNVPHDLPDVVADPLRAGQVLRNLLDNAAVYTSPGGRIEIRAAACDTAVEFTVADSGPGIAPEHLSRIFDRFYRTDASRSRRTGGSGLGLAIVKQLVEAQGGTVRVASTLDEGAAFTFTLASVPGSARA